jgi:cytochrome c oxidase assembly protein subunit 15
LLCCQTMGRAAHPTKMPAAPAPNVLPLPCAAAGTPDGVPTYNRAIYVLALLTTCATFPLIFLGGLVTSHGAGMSVPDWPNSYGYNMFTFPPSRWLGGIFYEHTHRLLGSLVGLFATLLFLVAQGWGAGPRARRRLLTAGLVTLAATVVAVGVPVLRRTHAFELLAFVAVVLIGSAFCRHREQRRWVRWLTALVLAGVIVQGVLGGLRVVMVKLGLAVVHGCFAQAFFCLAAFATIATSRWWLDGPAVPSAARSVVGRRLVRLAVVAVCAVYVQLVIGAFMRHFGAGLAIPDVPLAYGRWLPPTGEAAINQLNDVRVYELHLGRTSLAAIWVHFTHRIGAVVVSALVLSAVATVLRWHRAGATWGVIGGLFAATLGGLVSLGMAHAVGSTKGVLPGFVLFAAACGCGWAALRFLRRLGDARRLLAPAVAMAALLVVQVTLGVLTVMLRKPADVASAHVAAGALLLVTTFVLTVRAARTYAPVARRAGAREADENATSAAGIATA